MMEDASASRVAAKARGGVVSDFQKRLAGVQDWLGSRMQEGANTIARLGKEKAVIAERIGGARNELWTSVSGFGEHLQRTAMLHMEGAPRPLMAAMSLGLPTQLEAKHVFDIAMSTEQVAKRLDGVPVYTVSNSANEFVLVSDSNASKSLGIFCFREADAQALLTQVFSTWTASRELIGIFSKPSALKPHLRIITLYWMFYRLRERALELNRLFPAIGLIVIGSVLLRRCCIFIFFI